MNATTQALLLASAALMASCGAPYHSEGHATVSGNSVYEQAQRVVYTAPGAVTPPAPRDSNIAYYVPSNTVPRGVREIHIIQKVPAVQQPSPQEFLKHAPAPEPEPVVEDSELEHISPELLEQPAGTGSRQVPAGTETP